ncbi:MAG: diaminopimelate decarboxylase [Acholeplasmataceae bacterium]
MKIGSYNLNQLKEKYGTPLYLYDETIILKNINIFKNNFKSHHFQTEIIYAGKAFLTKYMAKLINEHNLSLDCVSRGEVFTALSSNFNPNKIVLHGNNKTEFELTEAINQKIGMIIIDNYYEANLLLNLNNQNFIPKVMLRINLAFDVNTHKYIKTSIEDSKFGVPLNSETISLIKKLKEAKNLNFVGLHSHIGSQILDEDYFYQHAKLMLKLYYDLKVNHNIILKELNLGGGFGIKYTKLDNELNLKELLNKLIKTIEIESKDLNINLTKVSLEPGRSIIGNAGYTLYTINQIKKTPHLNYLFVDGSMNDNLRTALYQAKYDALIVNKEEKPHHTLYKVAGKACESGDIIIDEIYLPEALPDDLLLVKSTGAYHYSMASNYNRLLIPAVIFINNDQLKLVVRKQTLEDLVRYDEEI